MRLLRDFRNFAFGGSVVDLAIGLALGAAFGDMLQSLVDHIITPFVAAIFGKPNFDSLHWKVGHGDVEYGAFLTSFVGFVLLAFVVMLLVKGVVRLTGHEPAGAQGSRECPWCKEWIAVDALVCKECTRDVEPVVKE